MPDIAQGMVEVKDWGTIGWGPPPLEDPVDLQCRHSWEMSLVKRGMNKGYVRYRLCCNVHGPVDEVALGNHAGYRYWLLDGIDGRGPARMWAEHLQRARAGWQPRVWNLRTDPCPPGTIRIGRPSRWGNPFKIGRDGTREEVVAKYEQYLLGRPDLLARLPDLRGKDLACWCHPLACHGDVLLRLANPK